jgi:hypothetical protein
MFGRWSMPGKGTRHQIYRSLVGGPQAVLDGCGPLRLHHLSNLRPFSPSESLYRLRYPAQRLWLILNPVTGILCNICCIRFSYLCGVDINGLELTSISCLERFLFWYIISLQALRSFYLNITHIQNFF